MKKTSKPKSLGITELLENSNINVPPTSAEDRNDLLASTSPQAISCYDETDKGELIQLHAQRLAICLYINRELTELARDIFDDLSEDFSEWRRKRVIETFFRTLSDQPLHCAVDAAVSLAIFEEEEDDDDQSELNG